MDPLKPVSALFDLAQLQSTVCDLTKIPIIEPPCGKTNNVVFEQVRHKPVCAVTEAG